MEMKEFFFWLYLRNVVWGKISILKLLFLKKEKEKKKIGIINNFKNLISSKYCYVLSFICYEMIVLLLIYYLLR